MVLSYIWEQDEVVIKAKQDSLIDLLKLLDSKEIDVILSDRPIVHERHRLNNREIWKKKMVFVGNIQFVDMPAKFPASLNQVPFCTYCQSLSVRHDLDKYFKKAKVSPMVIGEFDDVNLLQAIAEKGKAVVALPEDLAYSLIKQERLIKIGEPQSSSISTWAITRTDCKLNTVLQKSLDSLIQMERVLNFSR